MSLCQAKRGFFTLYDCPKDVSKTCEECNRELCTEHFPDTLTLCIECVAKQNADSDNLAVRSYQIRHENLLKKETSPIYFGTNLTDYYDQYDLRSFDMELSNIADMADSPDEIFFDS